MKWVVGAIVVVGVAAAAGVVTRRRWTKAARSTWNHATDAATSAASAAASEVKGVVTHH